MSSQVKSKVVVILSIILFSVVAGCQQNAYVVLSDRVVMNTKDGKAYPISLDSTFHVYDHIRINKSGEVTPIRSLTKSH